MSESITSTITKILVAHGEHLCGEDGVDEAVCEAAAKEIVAQIPMLARYANGTSRHHSRAKTLKTSAAIAADRDEAIAELAFMAGNDHLNKEDSRFVLATFIRWADEFSNKHIGTVWDGEEGRDFMIAIEQFYEEKKNIALDSGWRYDNPAFR